MNTRKQYKYVNVIVPKGKKSNLDKAIKKIGGTAAAARGKIFELGISEYERRLAEGKDLPQ